MWWIFLWVITPSTKTNVWTKALRLRVHNKEVKHTYKHTGALIWWNKVENNEQLDNLAFSTFLSCHLNLSPKSALYIRLPSVIVWLPRLQDLHFNHSRLCQLCVLPLWDCRQLGLLCLVFYCKDRNVWHFQLHLYTRSLSQFLKAITWFDVNWPGAE